MTKAARCRTRNVSRVALALVGVCASATTLAQEAGGRWQTWAVAPSGARTLVELPSGALLTVRTVRRGDKAAIVVARSGDVGKSWKDGGVVAEDVAGTDLGDCHLVRLRDGRLWCSFRRNHVRGIAPPDYAIEVAESGDNGVTWRAHSVVARSRPETGAKPSRGLWSSFLLERRDGTLECYYDDEARPFLDGFPGHQWVSVRAWDGKAWGEARTVSRAHDARHLSRDGMPSVIETAPGRLVVVFESVQVDRPHANLVRFVTSDDGGRTWSWQREERGVVYAPEKNFMALSPWVIRLRDGRLWCVFCTDEDRERPDVSGTPPHRLNMDVKSVESIDAAKTWSRRADLVYAGEHRNYMPGGVCLTMGPHRGDVLVQLVDFTAEGYRGILGTPARAGNE